MNWKTFGHNSIKEILEKQLSSGFFPHAYFFAGPAGVGKKMLALEFAQSLLGTTNLQNHPDFQMLDIKGEVTMNLVLDFIGKLGYKPFLGSKKIAIINNAQNLNTQSSNALLKTLEEPSATTIIILIANSVRLLPTIVSRCQTFNFNVFSGELMAAFAKEKKILITQEMLDLSFGSPSRLEHLAEDADFFTEQKKIIQQYRQLLKMSTGEKLAAINNFSELDQQQLDGSLLMWLFWQNSQLKNQPKNYVKVRAIAGAREGLAMNKNKKLVLQSLFLTI